MTMSPTSMIIRAWYDLLGSMISSGGLEYCFEFIIPPVGSAPGQKCPDPCDDHIHRHSVEPPFGEDHIGIALGRLDELEMHGSHAGLILLNHTVDRPAALYQIALQPADEADVGIGVDEDFDVEKPAQVGLREHQNPLDQDHRLGLEVAGLARPGMDGEIVDGNIDRLPAAQ